MQNNSDKVMKFIEQVEEALIVFPDIPGILISSVEQWNSVQGDYKLRVDTLELEPGNIVFDV